MACEDRRSLALRLVSLRFGSFRRLHYVAATSSCAGAKPPGPLRGLCPVPALRASLRSALAVASLRACCRRAPPEPRYARLRSSFRREPSPGKAPDLTPSPNTRAPRTPSGGARSCPHTPTAHSHPLAGCSPSFAQVLCGAQGGAASLPLASASLWQGFGSKRHSACPLRWPWTLPFPASRSPGSDQGLAQRPGLIQSGRVMRRGALSLRPSLPYTHPPTAWAAPAAPPRPRG